MAQDFIVFIVLFLSLLLLELAYIHIAQKAGIYDIPNIRSSHKHRTVRGGGIAFWVAGLFFLILNHPEFLLFFLGLTIVAMVSFTDDLRTLSRWQRILSHLAGITLVFLSLDLFHLLPWSAIAAGYILFIGILNAYNIMDGINGITGLYSLSVLGSLQYVNMKIVPFTEPDFIWYPMIACLAFLFFNFRRRALCFAGEVGSISVAFWIVSLLFMLMVKTNTIIWLLLLSVYGIDSIFTVFHRLCLRQNIFEAHRIHFYQVLANEGGIDHRIVSVICALLQTLIAGAVIMLYDKITLALLSSIILIPLGLMYFVKFRVTGLGFKVKRKEQ